MRVQFDVGDRVTGHAVHTGPAACAPPLGWGGGQSRPGPGASARVTSGGASGRGHTREPGGPEMSFATAVTCAPEGVYSRDMSRGNSREGGRGGHRPRHRPGALRRGGGAVRGRGRGVATCAWQRGLRRVRLVRGEGRDLSG